MEQSRQESVSRQSSILKAPKQRQPLQIVATNPSSSESSPTIKLKRRVSFAKNKRIREFCNEVEPKEGLDDSYEEHDLSSTKSSSGNSTDQPLVISVACEDKENFPIQLFIPTDQVVCKEIQPGSCVEDDNLSQCEMEMDNSINMSQPANVEMQINGSTLPNATIYFDDGMDITASIQPQIISAHVEEDDCYNDTVPVSQTYIEDVPMEMTENLQPILSKKLVNVQSANYNVNFGNNSLNFTEPVSAILGIGHMKKLLESQQTKLLTGNCENETECFTDVPLEFTSIIPSSTWIRPHNQTQGNDESDRFNCKTMEFTEVAQIHNIMSKKNNAEEIVNTSDKVMEVPLTRGDSKMSNASLKQTQHNEVCQEINNIPHNISTVVNEARSNQNVINQSSNVNHSLLGRMQEKTSIFPNASMEITEAVPVFNEINTPPLDRQKIQEEILQEKTKFAIDASMEMTEMIASQNKIDQPTAFKNKVLESDINKTKVFCNTSMEMTEAIHNCQKINHLNEDVPKTYPENIPDKTKHFNHNSMEMTEVVGFNKIQRSNHCKNQSVAAEKEKTLEVTRPAQPENIPDKTKHFNDNAMEMTEAVGFNKIQRLNHCKNQLVAPENEKTLEITRPAQLENTRDKTKHFNDNSMEMTEAVDYNKIQRSKIIFHCKNQLVAPENEKTLEITRPAQPEHTRDKTKHFNDNSMEMTEAVDYNDYNKIERSNHCKNQSMALEKEKTLEITRSAQPENIQEKTKHFNDNSMEMTEAVDYNKIQRSNHCKNQLVAPDKENAQFSGIAGKSRPGSIPDKIKLLNDNSMEMTEALGFNKIQRLNHCGNQSMAPEKEKTQFSGIAGKAPLGNMPDETKLFNDNSMEITGALGFNEIKKSRHCKRQLLATGNEKTQLFFNTSMEITEAVPIHNKIGTSSNSTNKTHQEITQNRTKFFNDKSMEITEAILHHKSISPHSKYDNNKSSELKTKLFINTSMEITEGAPGLFSKINQPTEDAKPIPEHVTLQNTEFFCNKSMEITEAVPAYYHINPCSTGKGKNQQEITEDMTKIFQNKSMEVTEAVLNYNKSDVLCNSKHQPVELGQERTKLFFNSSIEITEAAPVISRAHQLGSKLKNTFCKNISGPTENVQNMSMEMTEAVKNCCSKNYQFEKSTEKSGINERGQEITTVFPNLSVTEMIPVNKECNGEKSAGPLNQSNLNGHRGIQSITSDNKTINILRDDKTKYFNKSMDFTEISPILNQQNVSSYVQSEVPNFMTDKTKNFYNNSMDLTGAVMNNPNSICTNPSVLSQSMKDSERSHQYDSTLPNEINVPNHNHGNSQKDEVFNRSTYRDKSFHRMTTDELHTLCASMNLPTQNYKTERSTTLQNDYISICNDVNVLRDSLKKNSMFQQNFTIGTGISIALDNNMQIPTDICENSKKQDDLQIFCNTNCDSVERSVTSRKQELKILPPAIGSQKEYNTNDKYVSGEENLRISGVQSMELDIRNSQDQNFFNTSNKLYKNTTSSNDLQYSDSNILNDKQNYETQSNTQSFNKSELLRIHHTSTSFSNSRKSSTKRISAEMDENCDIAENSLKRLPSDNTDFLIATMGVRTELSHPLIINDKTIIKIPLAPLENNADTLTFSSNETIRPEENISGGEHEKSSKDITTSTVESDVFDEKCHSSNKDEIPKNKESLGKTESSLESSMNKLDEIQPPSFLCSDSFQNESIVDADMLDNKSSDVTSSEILKEPVNVISDNRYCADNSKSSNSKNSSTRKSRQSFEQNFSPSTSINVIDNAENFSKENNEPTNKIASFNSSKFFNESVISLINEEDVNTDPVAPFTALIESIEIYEKRDDCIWTIRKIDQKTVAVDFISKSFVTVIRLNEIEKACIKDIDNIEFISRLHSGSKNILLKIVHRLLLSKLNPDKLLSEYKMYEDVLPLLDCISKEVILAMNFMFDLERLSSLNLLNVESERVVFMVSSKKANIILEISLMLKVFNEIGPDDISVTCVLGDVRINDIKQLVVNIKKDSKFLSRYINDVKDYIMLMEESTHVQR